MATAERGPEARCGEAALARNARDVAPGRRSVEAHAGHPAGRPRASRAPPKDGAAEPFG